MASFPGSVWSPTSKSAGQAIDAAHVNDAQSEIVAIEDGYRNATAPLNSSRSTVATLSVTGGSTFAGPVVLSTTVTSSGTLNITGALQLGGAAGSSGQFLKSEGGSSSPSWATFGLVTGYVSSFADVVGSTGSTQAIHFTVPANAMADGDVIDIHVAALFKNASGGAAPGLFKAKWGTVSSTGFSVGNWGDAATEYPQVGTFRLHRVGANVWFDAGNRMDAVVSGTPTDRIAAPTFSSDQVVAIICEFTSSNSSMYYKPQRARVIRYAAS